MNTTYCNCWLSRADEYTRFVARRGAHAVDCPCYRRSGDPVDQLHDEHMRNEGERADRAQPAPVAPCASCGSHPAVDGGLCEGCAHAVDIHGAMRVTAYAHTCNCDDAPVPA